MACIQRQIMGHDTKHAHAGPLARLDERVGVLHVTDSREHLECAKVVRLHLVPVQARLQPVVAHGGLLVYPIGDLTAAVPLGPERL